MAWKKRAEAEMKMWSFSLGVTRVDRIINKDITGATHVRCSVEKAKGTIMRGFAQRRDSEQLLQKTFIFYAGMLSDFWKFAEG